MTFYDIIILLLQNKVKVSSSKKPNSCTARKVDNFLVASFSRLFQSIFHTESYIYSYRLQKIRN